jgi:hypothetical protein
VPIFFDTVSPLACPTRDRSRLAIALLGLATADPTHKVKGDPKAALNLKTNILHVIAGQGQTSAVQEFG